MMSPQTALHDSVFRAYLVIVPVSLAIGGGIVGFLHFGLKKDLGAIWKTYHWASSGLFTSVGCSGIWVFSRTRRMPTDFFVTSSSRPNLMTSPRLHLADCLDGIRFAAKSARTKPGKARLARSRFRWFCRGCCDFRFHFSVRHN